MPVSQKRQLNRSAELQRRAENLLPGGVDSPVRAFRAVGGSPPFAVRGEGAYLWDADGNRYLDYFGSWGPMILGHAFPPVVEAIQHAAANSASFGASTPSEGDLAELVIDAYPSIEKLRFVSSGTEATMSAIRLARASTKRDYIIKFEGCYHGHSDGLLVKAGSGVATFGIPGSAGVPDEIAHFTLALPFNDIFAVEAAFAEHRGQIACVILEPIVGNMGCVPPVDSYLQALRDITQREQALLIFDEVMTGFRVAYGGAQELYGVQPDMTTLGKIIGGGLPCGAFGARSEIMDMLAPLGPVYQAGTLSGNPLAMAAGIATVSHLKEHRNEVYARLEALSAAVADGVAAEAARIGLSLTTNRVGAMFTWFFAANSVIDFESAVTSDTATFARFHQAMLDQGIWLPPSQYEAAFMSTAHTMDDVAHTISAAKDALQGLAEKTR
ncbi:glutamate-1-semialdehyde 2,1-aminomutase [Alloacidobacterium dinghuense]|uniref:Glutamate-1-semialdehyde 2,1-aminomutase n=1 Tax=Alloacidobacterium dinghuense TaxID=2763107 RepID=A0A7G8BHR2_9BACT|nr:glutamate-1-semialdehyde 2,1-aminomutase [Alloacidobacterium dinghuense]QNI32082.1 glutamate-1-semialdehyde 2,1-aminomutase [Alloacidobacterium dinghuense]